MKVGDVVLIKTEADSDLRWVGVVGKVSDNFIEFCSICTSLRDGERHLYSVDTERFRDPRDLIIIGHVDDSISIVQQASA